LRLLNDPELRQRLGAAARPVAVAGFSTDTVLDRYEELFASILPGHGGMR
jgi:glycosyltransferase involved in cell wall biosynthesis